MERFLQKLKDIEIWINSLWKWEFSVFGQKLDFGSWKILISLPSHILIGFLCSLISLIIIGIIWKAFLIGVMASCLLEWKDVYYFTAWKEYTMYLQSGIDMIWYSIGAGLILLLI